MNDDQKNPYKWECKKHGSGYGPIDECPYCMEENYNNNPPDEYHYCPECKKPVDTEHDDGDSVLVYWGKAGWDFVESTELIDVYHGTCFDNAKIPGKQSDDQADFEHYADCPSCQWLTFKPFGCSVKSISFPTDQHGNAEFYHDGKMVHDSTCEYFPFLPPVRFNEYNRDQPVPKPRIKPEPKKKSQVTLGDFRP